MGEFPLVSCSPKFLKVKELLARVAQTDAEVLISGPTGVGKEVFAVFIHRNSPRRAAAFVPVNCGALPPELFENELFGHVGGAFTGARPRSEGMIGEANGGTLFLDEVDSMPLACQVKILRFLQDKQYRRLGEARIRQADVRVVAATNTNLRLAVDEKRFREDLFFRLRVVPVEVPRLAERREDIPLLLEEYAQRWSREYRLPRVVFSEEAAVRLREYSWPGNVRELENCVKYLTTLQLTRPVDPYDIPFLDLYASEGPAGAHADLDERTFRAAKSQIVSDFERHYLEAALRRTNGNIARAALASAKPRRVFFELMRKHELQAADYIASAAPPQSSSR
jgi:DNA-binding NtrC family response regulator